MPGWAISLLSVVIGAALGCMGALHLQRRQARAEAEHARREALGIFFARLSYAVGLASEWPTTPGPSAFERAREFIIGQSETLRTRDWIRTQQRIREVFGDRLYEPAFQFLEAYGRLRFMPLDRAVRTSIDECADYLGRLTAQRTDEVKAEWEAVRRRFFVAVEASGDAPAIELVESAADRVSDRSTNSRSARSGGRNGPIFRSK